MENIFQVKEKKSKIINYVFLQINVKDDCQFFTLYLTFNAGFILQRKFNGFPFQR